MFDVNYIWMFVSIAFATLNGLILRSFKNRTFSTPGDAFLFNAAFNALWAPILLIWFFASGCKTISIAAVVFGVVYGILLCLFLYFKSQSNATGPVALTSLIASCAFIPATWFGVIYAKETVSVFQLVGMVLIFFALFLCIRPQKGSIKLTPAWLFYTTALFAIGSVVGMFYKVLGRSSAATEVTGMMLVASVISSALLCLLSLLINKTKKLPAPTVKREALPYLLLAGVTGCIYMRLNASLSATLPSAIVFPAINGGIVMLSTVGGFLAFREKLTRLQLLGIGLGLLAILIIGCGQLVWNWIF